MSEVTSTQSVNGSNSSVIVEEENWYRDVEIVDNARTLELSDEEAERLMPQPTTKAPWFGYESSADYGEDGLDAVADNDADTKSSGGRAGAAKASGANDNDGPSTASDASEGKGGGVSTSIGDVTVQDNSTTNVSVGDVSFSASCSLDTRDDGGGTTDHHKSNDK